MFCRFHQSSSYCEISSKKAAEMSGFLFQLTFTFYVCTVHHMKCVEKWIRFNSALQNHHHDCRLSAWPFLAHILNYTVTLSCFFFFSPLWVVLMMTNYVRPNRKSRHNWLSLSLAKMQTSAPLNAEQ